MTTKSIDYMDLTEEDKEGDKDTEASVALGRPIIVGIDNKTGGVHAHQVKCKGCGDTRIAIGIAANIEELGHGGGNLE